MNTQELMARLQSIRKGIDAQHRVRDRCICIGCDRWNPIGHPEAHGHTDDCTEMARVKEERDTRARLDALITELQVQNVKPGDCIHCGKDICNEEGWCNSFQPAPEVKP
jgi:hypothetical protein